MLDRDLQLEMALRPAPAASAPPPAEPHRRVVYPARRIATEAPVPTPAATPVPAATLPPAAPSPAPGENVAPAPRKRPRSIDDDL